MEEYKKVRETKVGDMKVIVEKQGDKEYVSVFNKDKCISKRKERNNKKHY